MSENCNGRCEDCASKCEQKDFREPFNENSSVKKVIGVVSGKGGVGKSLVTSLLAVAANKKGSKTAILDADITGPSIPKAFGATERAFATDDGIIPNKSKNGVEIMSINLLLEDDEAPVVWRGPVISGVVKQFWHEVIWGDIDYMFIDMPPGTGDVPLTVFQSIPLDGIVIVTTPQDLVSMIVKKAYNMAKLMNIPVLGIVENMSYVECPDCGKKIYMFGEGKSEKIAEELGLPLLAQLPINPEVASRVDSGEIEEADTLDLFIALKKIDEILD
ncbi:MAG: Mrp/NBP35 family ATP-binding protein [Ruminococcaceae bacterium]|jgi:Mrp family chromosome partitioning ATPase|nr:Mrp/NBP35 family ATP-binding protein [Oscillospiraceae bacterium]